MRTSLSRNSSSRIPAQRCDRGEKRLCEGPPPVYDDGSVYLEMQDGKKATFAFPPGDVSRGSILQRSRKRLGNFPDSGSSPRIPPAQTHPRGVAELPALPESDAVKLPPGSAREFLRQFLNLASNRWSLRRATGTDSAELYKEAKAIVKPGPSRKRPRRTDSFPRVLRGHALGDTFACQLAGEVMRRAELELLFSNAYKKYPSLISRSDLRPRSRGAPRPRLQKSYLEPLLFFKGFPGNPGLPRRAFCGPRAVRSRQKLLQSIISHQIRRGHPPPAKIGHGILMDHATNIVIGETAKVGNDVSFLHGDARRHGQRNRRPPSENRRRRDARRTRPAPRQHSHRTRRESARAPWCSTSPYDVRQASPRCA